MKNTRNEKMLQVLGVRLQKIRKEKGLSLRKLAELAEVDFSQIHRIEKGESNPSYIMLITLANALQVPASYLVNFEGVDLKN